MVLRVTLGLLLVASMPLSLLAQDAQGSLGEEASSVPMSLEAKVRELEEWVPKEEDYEDWARASTRRSMNGT